MIDDKNFKYSLHNLLPISFAVVIIWRSIWNLMDYYVPIKPLNDIICIILAFFVLWLFHACDKVT